MRRFEEGRALEVDSQYSRHDFTVPCSPAVGLNAGLTRWLTVWLWPQQADRTGAGRGGMGRGTAVRPVPEVPSPSWPAPLAPQVKTAPPSSTQTVCRYLELKAHRCLAHLPPPGLVSLPAAALIGVQQHNSTNHMSHPLLICRTFSPSGRAARSCGVA